MKKAKGRKIDRSSLLLGLAGIATLFVVWQLVSGMIVNKNALPAPAAVFARLFQSFVKPIGPYNIFGHIAMSLQRVMIGYLAAAVSGITLGLLMAWFKSVEAVIKPIFELIRPIPPLAWIPMAIIWFGIGELTKYFIIFIATFTTITLNAYEGARSVDPELIGAGQMLGASQSQIFFTVVLRSAVPQIFAGLQVALSSGWMAVLAAEMVRSMDGVGWIIIRGMEVGDTTQILVGMIAIAVVGFALAQVMRLLERRLCIWNEQGT